MTNELYHHGILGMKWGIRRYQNKDGSLTSVGKMRVKRLQRAIDTNDRDVADLKKHGYVSEADAVKAVGDRNREKLAGMRRYNKSLANYEKADLRYKTAKKNNSNTEIDYARLGLKIAKKLLSSVGATTLSVATNNYITGTPGYDKVNKYLIASGLLAVTVAGAIQKYQNEESKRSLNK